MNLTEIGDHKSDLENGLTVCDGYLVNEDGEVVGLANFSVSAPQGEMRGISEDGLPVRDEIEAILERRAKANSKIAAINAEFDALIKGFQDRKESLVREQQRRIEYLDYAYGPMVEKYLTENRGKNKSLVMKWGTLGTRKSSSTAILDEDMLIEWCEKNCPEAVKYSRSVLKSQLPDETPFSEKVEKEEFYVKH